MIEAAFVGGLLAIGIVLFLRGAYPGNATLAERIAELDNPFSDYDLDDPVDEQSLVRLRQRLAMAILRTTKGDKMAQVEADVAVSRGDVVAFAVDKMSAGLGVAIMVCTFGLITGILSTLGGVIIASIGGAALGYVLPEIEVSRKAKTARTEFERALNAFVGLVSVSMSGGGGLNTAMSDAAMVGSGWVFEVLRGTLNDAQLRGEPAWKALDRLGHRFNVDGLIELSGALGLAGGSGARVTETLIARAESGRKKEIAEARAEAERTTANLGLPVGTMVMGWLGYLGYPALSSLLSGLT